MSRIRVLETGEQFASMRGVWDILVERTPTNNIFLTHDWLYTWWEHLRGEAELLLLVVDGDNGPVGLAPLMISHGTLRFIGDPNADYCDFIGSQPGPVVEAVVDWLFANRSRWRNWDLSQIPGHSPSLPALREALSKHRARFREQDNEVCMAFVYEGSEGERAKFAMKKPVNLRNAFNYFERLGGMSFERVRAAEQIEQYLPAFYHSHIMRWRDTPTPSKFERPEQRAFYGELIRRLTPAGRLFLAVTTHGDTPFAFLFGYDYGNAVHLYTVINESFHQRKSPGIVLFHCLTEDCVRQGYDKVDFARGAGSHKVRFVNRTTHNHRILVHGSAAAYAVARSIEAIKRTGPVRKIITGKRFGQIKTRIMHYAAQHGLLGLTGTLLRKAGRLVVDHRKFLINAYLDPVENLMPTEAGIQIETLTATEENVERIVSFYGAAHGSAKHATIEARFREGAACYAALHHGCIVGLVWCLFREDSDPDSGLVVTPDDHQAISSDALVAVPYRGKRILPSLRNRMVTDLRARGLELIAAVEATNVLNRRSMLKARYRHLRTVHVVKLFGKRVL